MVESKSQVRRRHRTLRAELGEPEAQKRGQRLSELLSSRIPAGAVVAGYAPMRGEPDVLPFLRTHRRRGGRVYLPVVVDSAARQMHWARWTESAGLRRSALLPVLEPAGARFSTAELLQHCAGSQLTVLVPALAVDAHGGRLGQGGGFYDTVFLQHPELAEVSQLLAVVHTEEVLAAGSFPVEDHDLRVPQAVTPERIIDLMSS